MNPPAESGAREVLLGAGLAVDAAVARRQPDQRVLEVLERGGMSRARFQGETTVKNLRPNLALIKPHPPRTDAACEAEALRFLQSWTRARTRLAIVRLSDHLKTLEVTPPKPKGSDGAAVA